MMLLVLSLARKCDEKAQVRHQVMLLLERLGEEKWKEEGDREIKISKEKLDPNLYQRSCIGNVGKK